MISYPEVYNREEYCVPDGVKIIGEAAFSAEVDEEALAYAEGVEVIPVKK